MITSCRIRHYARYKDKMAHAVLGFYSMVDNLKFYSDARSVGPVESDPHHYSGWTTNFKGIFFFFSYSA